LVKLDFVVTDLGRDNSFFRKKPVDWISWLGTRTRDVDPYPSVPQIAVGFKNALKSVLIEDDAYPWSIALVHFIDPESEDNGKILFASQFGK